MWLPVGRGDVRLVWNFQIHMADARNSCPPVQITDQRRHETGPIVGAAALAQRLALNWCPEPV